MGTQGWFSFFFFPALASSSWFFEDCQDGETGPACRSQALGMPSEFQPHEMGQSHFQKGSERGPLPGRGSGRNLQCRLPGSREWNQ